MGDAKIEVLKGLSFSLKQGELVSIVGASGTGKSTLLHLLGLLDSPDGGEIFYGSENIWKFKEEERARFRNVNIGFVFQFHHLLMEFSSLENVMIPQLINGKSMKEARELAVNLLSEVGLGERVEHRPSELSGGEQQRVALARALAMSPKIVLADEPTGNLDKETGDEVFELLRALNKSKNESFVIATHNLDIASKSDRVLRLEHGKLTQIDVKAGTV